MDQYVVSNLFFFYLCPIFEFESKRREYNEPNPGASCPLHCELTWELDILMDGPPAQSLGVEPVDPSIMVRPPRPKRARALTKPLIRRVLTSAALIMLGTLA